MAQANEEDEWDKDTDEINSIDSDELYETRPNRWKGPPSSWATITEQDRLTYAAFQELRNRDLAIHLYNASALKRGARTQDGSAPVPDEDINAHTGEVIKKHDWIPPQTWTAWPLRADLVPDDDFMKRTEDEDEILTCRRRENTYPSSSLEEAISATVLSFAKEKFRQRDLSEQQITTELEAKGEAVLKGDEDEPSSGQESSEDGSDQKTSTSETKASKRPRTVKRSFSPMVSTNDDLSYDLIRPSTRLILEKLDKTLSVLHNARVAAVRYDAETSASEVDDDATPSKVRLRSSSRGERRRSLSIAPSSGHKTEDEGRRRNKKGAGRPRKKSPQPKQGETHREFLVRIAREQHKRIPTFSDEETDAVATSSYSKRVRSRSRQERSRSRSRSRDASQISTPVRDNGGLFKMEHISQWKLRDWKDVIGAASLAGFSPTVLARATERCVDLFDEKMGLHTLNEARPGVDTAVVTTEFEPGNQATSSPNDSDEGNANVDRARAMSRQASGALSVTSSSDPEMEVKKEENGDESTRKRRARSRSITPSPTCFYCTHATCKRAVQGFSRRNNLIRHMRLVHREILKDQRESEDSLDEMDGAVHLDGFLKPIKPRPGWRSEDVKQRSRSRKRAKDDDGDIKVTETD